MQNKLTQLLTKFSVQPGFWYVYVLATYLNNKNGYENLKILVEPNTTLKNQFIR
jgi:hypothetical protein